MSSGLASLGNSLKLSFGRYSPARLSLRKADMKLSKQMIESAITSFSPGGITGKKSNELIQGGLSHLKYAATSVVKKFDEIKEAISANSTPVKGAGGGSVGERDTLEEESSEREGSGSLNIDGGSGAPSEAEWLPQNLPDNLYPTNTQFERPDSDFCVRVMMSSCSQCHNCLALLYDEEIMGGWSAEDSNLNTRCPACLKHTVPLLSVTVLRRDEKTPESISVPYLNPLVLRKELESILAHEGDSCLADPRFIDEHPIIYWNLVWAFERVNITSHLPDLLNPRYKKQFQARCGQSLQILNNNNQSDKLCKEISQEDVNAGDVGIQCLWDNPRLHGELGLALRGLWRPTPPASSLLSALLTDHTTASPHRVVQQVLDGLRSSDLTDCLRKLQQWRSTTSPHGKYHSLYRDVLFLAIGVLGRQNVDLVALQREFTAAANRLAASASPLRPSDAPPAPPAICCRHYFSPLHLTKLH